MLAKLAAFLSSFRKAFAFPRKRLLCLLSIVLLGCNSNQDPDNSGPNSRFLKEQTINVAGLDRQYHLYLPPNPANAPVVFLFHGNGGSYDQIVGLTNTKAPHKVWLDLAESENFLVVIPNGLLGANNRRGWNDCRADAPDGIPTEDDVGFISALLDHVQITYQTDPQRTYVTGTSNGGHFSLRLAHEMPERLAAVAPIVAADAANSECPQPITKVSVLIMNGTNDTFVPYNGGQIIDDRGEVLSTDEMVGNWIRRNEITATPTITEYPDLDTSDESSVTKFLYTNSDDSVQVALYRVDGGGHTEPSIEEPYGRIYLAIVGVQNHDIEMAHEVWDFFKTKSR